MAFCGSYQLNSCVGCAYSMTILGVTMSPRPDVSEERKNQILEAALAVFARLGFQQTRMDDIAEQAGLSKGALYLYYKSKDAIIAALLKYFFTQEFKRLQAFVEADHEVSVHDQLMALTRQLAAAMHWMARLMPIAFEFYHDYRRELARLIQRGIERDEFRTLDAEATATTLAALYEGLALLYFVDPQAHQWAEQVETSVRLLLEGVAQHASS
jgi:AcrR family transcriptional regulator